MANTSLVKCRAVLFETAFYYDYDYDDDDDNDYRYYHYYYYYYYFVSLLLLFDFYYFDFLSTFRVVPGRFRGVLVIPARFRVGSGWFREVLGGFRVLHTPCFNCVARSSLPYVCRFRVGRSCPIKRKDNCFISYSCAFVM